MYKCFVCTQRECLAREGIRREWQSLQILSCRWLWATMWWLDIDLKFSKKQFRSFNIWALSPVPWLPSLIPPPLPLLPPLLSFNTFYSKETVGHTLHRRQEGGWGDMLLIKEESTLGNPEMRLKQVHKSLKTSACCISRPQKWEPAVVTVKCEVRLLNHMLFRSAYQG